MSEDHDKLESDLSQFTAENIEGPQPEKAGEFQPSSPGAPTSQQKALQEWVDTLQPALDTGFGVLAPGWQVTAEETKALSEAFAPVLQKYLPGNSIPVEVTAGLAVLAIVGPRLMYRMPLKEAAKSE